MEVTVGDSADANIPRDSKHQPARHQESDVRDGIIVCCVGFVSFLLLKCRLASVFGLCLRHNDRVRKKVCVAILVKEAFALTWDVM